MFPNQFYLAGFEVELAVEFDPEGELEFELELELEFELELELELDPVVAFLEALVFPVGVELELEGVGCDVELFIELLVALFEEVVFESTLSLASDCSKFFFLSLCLKSVSYQPLPFKRKPAAETNLSNVGF